MDKSDIGETTVDNSRLEELMKQDITPQMQSEFFDLLKESQLYLPVDFGPNPIKGIENMKAGDVIEGPKGFNINYIEYSDGKRAVPLFTSSEMMEKGGLRSSVIVMYMSDLADLLVQTDNYSEVLINPLTEYELGMPIEAFIDVFSNASDLLEALPTILNMLKEKSVELDDDYLFYLRSEDDFMKEDAADGIFTPDIPFNISSRDDFHSDMKYLNILIMPKSRRILFIGNVVDEDHYDTIVAPGSEFKFIEDRDEFTRIWECVAQPFYDE